MLTLKKIGVAIVATLIAAICAIAGAGLKALIGSFDLGFGFPMWVGALPITAPASGILFSLIWTILTFKRIEGNRVMFSKHAIIGLLAGFLTFDYMPM